MEGATHFIEQYQYMGRTTNTSAMPIEILSKSLRASKWLGFKTVAYFLIKPKPSALLAEYKPDLKATIVEQI